MGRRREGGSLRALGTRPSGSCASGSGARLRVWREAESGVRGSRANTRTAVVTETPEAARTREGETRRAGARAGPDTRGAEAVASWRHLLGAGHPAPRLPSRRPPSPAPDPAGSRLGGPSEAEKPVLARSLHQMAVSHLVPGRLDKHCASKFSSGKWGFKWDLLVLLKD